MAILLGDDGTLDTMVYCSECGKEYRGTYQPDSADSYTEFVEWLTDEFASEHICREEDY